MLRWILHMNEIVKSEALNTETYAAIKEVDAMIAGGQGEHLAGSTADFFAQLNVKPLTPARIG